MRIISGTLKGRLINFLKNSKTRPLKDTVKENIFNILKHSNFIKTKIESSNILDLYSGVGSFGIECISRGAKKVTFIEQDIEAANLLKENLIKLSIVNSAKIYNKKIESIFDENMKEKFNIFFFDSPFKNLDYINLLELIEKYKIYKSDHIVIIHREKKTHDDLKDFLNIIETKIYGRSKIIFGMFK